LLAAHAHWQGAFCFPIHQDHVDRGNSAAGDSSREHIQVRPRFLNNYAIQMQNMQLIFEPNISVAIPQ
jgi:hypothetical protein